MKAAKQSPVDMITKFGQTEFDAAMSAMCFYSNLIHYM